MEAFKVSLIFSFHNCISKASEKSHGSFIVIYIYFTLQPYLSQQEHSLQRISELWCCLADAILLFQFDYPEKHLNTTTSVCCFLLLLVLSYKLLTHCCYENLCSSMKKSFQVQEGNQCVRMHSCCNFVGCIHVATSQNDACSRVNNFPLLNEWLLIVLQCPSYRCLIMPAFSRLKIPF